MSESATASGSMPPPVPPIPTPPPPPPPPSFGSTLNLGGYEEDSATRQMLLGLGVQAGMLMMSKGTTPEVVASAVGVSSETMYRIMTGRETDLSFRVLRALATHLGGQISVRLVPNQPTSPGT